MPRSDGNIGKKIYEFQLWISNNIAVADAFDQENYYFIRASVIKYIYIFLAFAVCVCVFFFFGNQYNLPHV